MLPIVAVVAVLYGMALFAFLSTQKSEPEPVPEPLPLPPIARLVRDTNPPPTIAPTKDSSKDAAKPEPSKKSGEPVQVAKADTEKEKLREKRKSVPPERKNEDSGKKTAAKEEPAPPAPPPPPAKPEFWDLLAGLPGDSQFVTDPTGLTITIPPTLHVLSPDLNVKNSPHLLTEVSGDFTAIVRINGKIQPGTTPLKKLPFTFQGAGLIIWQDEDNYLRMERAAFFSQQKGKVHGVLVEVCKDGKIVATSFKDTRDTTLTLRLERKGGEARCQYSTDGKTWLDVKRQEISMPNVIGVGVSASNASPKPYPARFEAFELTGSDANPK
jgi:regulation of enolase protein 1 (concanavalin A-like superfamily)